MKNEKSDNLLAEHLRKIKYRVGYKLNESPKYRPLVNNGDEFDAVPKLTNEAGDQEDAPKAGGGEQPPAPSNDQPQSTDAPVPAFDKTGGDSGQLPPAGGAPAPTNAPPANGAPPVNAPPVNGAPPMEGNPMGDDMNAGIEPVEQVDDIQNDIIKHNIAAMQSIHDKLESLDVTVQGINSKLATLNADVEEVREPTNTEKLMSKKNVSYPYYFNLNDFWSGNWFNEQREKENEKGIKELPDGTFVADFDDLPQRSKIDVQDSFNKIS
jgi:hypothetical protein